MASSYEQDKKRVQDFYTSNWDKIKAIFKDTANIYNIEFDDNEIAKCFDRYCGIDFFASRNKKMYGVAARVNFMRKHHNHITIRYKRANGHKTEYQKRIESILKMGGELYASLTMQIDADESYNDSFVRAIIFQSDKLYMAIYKDSEFFSNKYMITNKKDGNLYFKIPHEDIVEITKTHNVRAKIYQNHDHTTPA